jgi:hypothetical protein
MKTRKKILWARLFNFFARTSILYADFSLLPVKNLSMFTQRYEHANLPASQLASEMSLNLSPAPQTFSVEPKPGGASSICIKLGSLSCAFNPSRGFTSNAVFGHGIS